MNAPAYDPDNIFAKILRGEAPCHFVCEDADTFVFMDIMPRSDGHALVIPKQPVRNILDAPQSVLAPLIQMTQKVAIAVKAKRRYRRSSLCLEVRCNRRSTAPARSTTRPMSSSSPQV